MSTDSFKLFLNEPKIQQIVDDLARQLNDDYHGEDVVMIGVLKGSLIFMADLARKLEMDPTIDFVRLLNFGKEENKTGTISIIKDIQTDIRNKHVLIVDQIIDSGRSIRFLYDRLLNSKPASVEIVTLLNKENKRLVELPIKYSGLSTTDQFLVGYGLDLEEKCRNYKDLYTLRYPN